MEKNYNNKELFFKVYNYTKPYKKLVFTSLFLTLILSFSAPLRPYLIQYTFDEFIAGNNKLMLLNYSALIILVLIAECFINYFAIINTGLLAQNIIRDIRNELYGKMVRFPLAYYDKNPIGTLVTRVISDIQNIADVFSQGFLEISGDILKILIIVSVMLYADWKLTLISLSTIPVLLYATNIFKNAIKKSFSDVRNAVANLNSFVQEHLSGMWIVKMFNKEDDEFSKFTELNNKHLQAHIRSNWAYSIFFPVVEVLSALSLGLLIWWGSGEIVKGNYSIGTIISFTLYINMLFRPIRQMADRFNTFQMGIICADRVFRVLENETEADTKNIGEKKRINGYINFENVNFSYNNANTILHNISFELKPGRTLALVGQTGSGKSTIISLMNRFYEYNEGKILIDEIEIKNYSLKTLRQNIGFIPQDVFLFSDTIRNNIVVDDFKISDEQIIEKANAIGAWKFIDKLPGKLYFNVKERGNQLSAGQKQLIAFLRVLIHNPSIVILDEATANLDSESEKLIQFATDKIMHMQTTIIVAHRLSTIINSDQIIVIDKGKIVEQGNHKELLEKNGRYFHLYQKQFQYQELNTVK